MDEVTVMSSCDIFANKNVLLGVSSSVAIYKSCELISLLKKAGASVRVIETKEASEFIRPALFEALTSQPCPVDVFEHSGTFEVEHIEWAKWADLIILAPATAHLIARLAHGLADDRLTTTVLASKAKVVFAPAMNSNMYLNPLTQENMDKLISLGFVRVDPDSGKLACGDVGIGKLASPERIFELGAEVLVNEMRTKCEFAKVSGSEGERNLELTLQSDNFNLSVNEGRVDFNTQCRSWQTINGIDTEKIQSSKCKFASTQDLKGKRILVTAGPTQEAIDPVRFISNHSSGKMGYSFAIKAQERGADVKLISGPVNLAPPESVSLEYVVSADEMYEKVQNEFDNCDYLIMTAAVSDFKPKFVATEKIKKLNSETKCLELVNNKDILLSLKNKKKNQIVCGFAMETQNLLENGKAKLEKKGLDLICCNSLREEGAGFASDTNHIYLITANDIIDLDKMSKLDLADKILDIILKLDMNRT